MIDLVRRTPDDFLLSYNKATGLKGWSLEKWPAGLLILGMGGSGISGLLLQTLMVKECPVPLIWSRDLFLPAYLDERWLVVAVSYSGNTWETLKTLQEVEALGLPWRGLASGGSLTAKAREAGALIHTLEPGLPPRSMSLAALAGLLALFHHLLPSLSSQIEETRREMAEDMVDWDLLGRSRLSPPEKCGAWPVFPRDPHLLADLLVSRFPLFYGWGMVGEAVAYRWMCQMAENAKVPSHAHRLPELLHNEIVAWKEWGSLRPAPVLLRIDTEARPVVDAAGTPWDRVWRELEGAGIEAWSIPAAGGSLLSRSLRQVLLGDAVSVLSARRRRVAATPVPAIERLKAER